MFKSIQTKTMFYLVAFSACFIVVSCYLVVFGIESASKDIKSVSLMDDARLMSKMAENALVQDPTCFDTEESRLAVLDNIKTSGVSEECFLINDRGIATGAFIREVPYDFSFTEKANFQEIYKYEKNYVCAVGRIDDSLGWYVVVEQLASDAYGMLNLMKTITIALIIVMLITLWNLARRISQKIQEPIRQLADAAVNVASGDISKGIETRENGELADIADSFNLMLEKLKSTMQQVLDKSGEAESMAEIMQFVEETYDNLPTAIISINNIGEITTFNKIAEELTGLNANQIIGLNVDNPAPYGIIPVIDTLKKCLREGSIQLKTITEIRHSDGTLIPIIYSISIQFGQNGEVLGAVCVFRRIEDMKKFQESATRIKSLNSLGEMAASLAHEIRNPLTSIKGYAQLMQLEHNAEEIDIIVHEVDRLNGMLNRFLNFAKPKTPNFQPCDINEIINYVVKLTRVNLTDNIKIVVNTTKVPFVMIDRELFEAAMLNLLLNATQALPNGGLIHVSSHYNSRRKMASIIIRDNGIGIPAENSDRLFDPFFTTRPDGTGMGLPIAARTVEDHGGVIEVESVEGEMTQFIIRLPVLNETIEGDK